MTISIEFVEAATVKKTAVGDYHYDGLEMRYEVEAHGFQLSATISTEGNCYDYKDFSETDEGEFNGHQFMNDVPSVYISSADCFDNETYFNVDTHCEIMRLLLTDYHARKTTYINTEVIKTI